MYKKLPNRTRESVDFCNAKEFNLHTKNKEEKLTKREIKQFPSPAMVPKFDLQKASTRISKKECGSMLLLL